MSSGPSTSRRSQTIFCGLIGNAVSSENSCRSATMAFLTALNELLACGAARSAMARSVVRMSPRTPTATM